MGGDETDHGSWSTDVTPKIFGISPSLAGNTRSVPMPALVTARPPLPEAGPSKASRKPTFKTLEREANFRRPSTEATPHPELQKLVAPHIDSFNALFDSGGLLEAAIKDIQPQVVWDGKGKESERGNRLESKLAVFCMLLGA
jgi:hypothetical protein